MSAAIALEGGFGDAVLGAQSNFRALMDALANPGTLQRLELVSPPAGLAPELGAVALTMCDHDTELWLAPELRGDAIVGWLRFQTAAPLTETTSDAAFALVPRGAVCPTLEQFALGSAEYPDRSTTLVLEVEGFDGGAGMTLMGPGINHERTIAPRGLPENFVAQWGANRALFPRGVDLLLVADGQVLGLPRSTRIGVEA